MKRADTSNETNSSLSCSLVAWYEAADHLDREDVMALLKVVLNICIFLSGKVLQTITRCRNGFSMFTSSSKYIYGVF